MTGVAPFPVGSVHMHLDETVVGFLEEKLFAAVVDAMSSVVVVIVVVVDDTAAADLKGSAADVAVNTAADAVGIVAGSDSSLQHYYCHVEEVADTGDCADDAGRTVTRNDIAVPPQ